jgi:hypothetical protein
MLDMTPATIKHLEWIAGHGASLEAERRAAIEAARSEGHSMQAIAVALGITRQRVHQLLSKGEK